MVRLYFYRDYHWDLINNMTDDTYQAIADFYYGTEMNEGYGEIKEIIKEWDETWKNATHLIQKVFICFKQKQELLYLLKVCSL